MGRSRLDSGVRRSYSVRVARTATLTSEGTPANVPSRPFRRSAPSPAEQTRRETWGRTVGPLVKQAYTALQGDK